MKLIELGKSMTGEYRVFNLCIIALKIEILTSLVIRAGK